MRKRETETTIGCAACGEPLDGEPGLSCPGCRTVLHRACRLELGRCLTAGCRRTRPLERSRAPSALDMDVGPYVWGAGYGLLLAGPAAALGALPFLPLWLLIGGVLGGLRARYC